MAPDPDESTSTSLWIGWRFQTIETLFNRETISTTRPDMWLFTENIGEQSQENAKMFTLLSLWPTLTQS